MFSPDYFHLSSVPCRDRCWFAHSAAELGASIDSVTRLPVYADTLVSAPVAAATTNISPSPLRSYIVTVLRLRAGVIYFFSLSGGKNAYADSRHSGFEWYFDDSRENAHPFLLYGHHRVNSASYSSLVVVRIIRANINRLRLAYRNAEHPSQRALNLCISSSAFEVRVQLRIAICVVPPSQ